MLWEIPAWQNQAVSRQEIPTNLKHQLPDVDTKTFLYHINTRLPLYQEQFYLAGRTYFADWAVKTNSNPGFFWLPWDIKSPNGIGMR